MIVHAYKTNQNESIENQMHYSVGQRFSQYSIIFLWTSKLFTSFLKMGHSSKMKEFYEKFLQKSSSFLIKLKKCILKNFFHATQYFPTTKKILWGKILKNLLLVENWHETLYLSLIFYVSFQLPKNVSQNRILLEIDTNRKLLYQKNYAPYT